MCISGKKAALNVICVLAVSLVFVVITGAFSMIDMPSYADDGVKAIQLVNNGAVAGIQGKQMSNVYFGNYKQSSDGEGGFLVEPIIWRVLQNEDGRLFILTDKNIDAKKLHNASDGATWDTLDLRNFLNGYGDYSNNSFIGTAFTDLERESIAVSHIETTGGNPTDDKVFLLSIQEARNTSFGFNWDGDTKDEGRRSVNTDYTNTNGIYENNTPDNRWFLRSMGKDRLYLSFVRPAGDISYNGIGMYGPSESLTRAWPFRSACRVDLGSVLFASAAVDGKVSGNTGAGALKATKAYNGSDWKLTVKDAARKFKVTETEAACFVNEKVELHYTDAEVFDAGTAPNEYISAVIVNQSGETLYYGRISRPTATDGTVELNIPRTLDAGTYDLKVFSEQYNGDRKTDYASEMSNISLTVSEPLVPYVNDAGRKQEPKVCKVMAAERETLSSDLSEWYAAVEDVSATKLVEIEGNVNLILCDGVKFNAPFGIMIKESSSLTIWAQSMGDEAGTIDTTSTLPINRAGIGFDISGKTGKLVINGGRIIAKGNSGSAGIGGSFASKNGGNVEINGGKVTAEGSKNLLHYAEAIGQGENGFASDDLKLGRVKVSVDKGRTYVKCDDRISSCRVKGKAVLVERCRNHEFENDVCRYCGSGRPLRIDDESNDLQVTLEPLIYNGKEQTQTVTKITLNGTDITDCCDISDNVQSDVGDYEMTIKADPECGYEGTVKWKFTIGKIVPSFTVYADDVGDDLSVSAANLTRSDTTIPGTLELKETSLLYGTNTYSWKFTPEDTEHYETVTGTVNITVSGHIWEFAGFEWTGNEKDGYTAVVAKYVCKNNSDHKDTVSKVTLTENVIKPTCTEGGKTEYTAVVEKADSLDGEKHTESKDAKATGKLGHDWKDATCTTAKTCSRCDATEGEPLGHKWEFAGFEWTGNEKDGYTAVEAKYVCKNNSDHKDTVSKVTLTDIVTKPTCTEGGKTVYTAAVEKTDSLDGEKHTESKDAKLTDKLGHDWKAATCTTPKTCSRCNDTEGEPLGHKWELAGFEWTGNEKDGYTAATAKYVCKNNADHKETVSKVTLTDIVTKPTCTEGGKTVYTAIVEKTDSLDGEKHTESKDAKLTDKLGHDWKEATCTEPKMCSVCGVTEGEPLGHSWDEGIVTKEATTTETGVKTFTCTVCETVRTEILPVLKPDEKEAEEAKEDKDLPTINIDKTDTVGNYKKKQMMILFPVNEKIDNYRIQYRVAGKKKWTNGWSDGKGEYIVKNLKKYSLCEFRIAGYVKLDDGTWIRSKWSKVSYRYVSSIPIKTVKGGRKSIKATWRKDRKSNGYRVQYSLKKNMAGKKIVTLNGKSKTKCTIKNLKPGKTYYIKVRPIKKRAGKVYLGILGATKKTRVK